ncbi:MAG: molybdenum cofactor biosynthesis protein MoaE [Chitinophagaceae bacterium]|nr:molybdenum cofactor biosynthesis protein MoaE [Chitinophagaceae bacterium]
MNDRKPKNIFIAGAISPQFIADSIGEHAAKKNIGAHSIFLGQVRDDVLAGKKITAIEYTAYEEMALDQMHILRESIFEKYSLTCMHVHHSLSTVEAGGICLFVFTSSAHRKAAIDACEETVEKIKKELPIWGNEVFDDSTHQWKINK